MTETNLATKSNNRIFQTKSKKSHCKAMQVICTLALHHPLTAVSHEVTLRYIEQMQHSSLSCFAVGHTSSSMAEAKSLTLDIWQTS